MTQRNISLTLTSAGNQVMVNAKQNNLDVTFSAIALGLGTVPLDATVVALTSQQEEQPIFSSSTPAVGQLSMSALFSNDPAAPYAVTEIGLIGDGVLLGVWSTNDPTQALVVRMPGVPYTATLVVAIGELPTQNIIVQTQGLDGVAQQLVNDSISNAMAVHIADPNPHKQYAPINSPLFTGNPQVPMPAPGDSSASAAPTGWVAKSYAPINSPVFTGNPQVPTPPVGDSSAAAPNTQWVTQTIELAAGNYLLDQGAANAYVVAPNPAISKYPNGLQIKFRAMHPCTGGCTLNAGAGVVPLLRDDGTAMHAGDVSMSALVSCTYDASTNAFLVNSIVNSQVSSQGGAYNQAYQTGFIL